MKLPPFPACMTVWPAFFSLVTVCVPCFCVLVGCLFLAQEYISICFPRDKKLLYAITGPPDYRLVVWSWERGRIICKVTSLSFSLVVFFLHGADEGGCCSPLLPACLPDVWGHCCHLFWLWGLQIPLVTAADEQGAYPVEIKADPDESTIVSVCGNKMFKVFRLKDNQLLPVNISFGKFMPSNFTCHEWVLSSVIVVGNDQGEMLVMYNGEFRTSLAPPDEACTTVFTIRGHSKGFVCGCNSGIIGMYEKTHDRRFFRLLRSFKLSRESHWAGRHSHHPLFGVLPCV